MRFDMNLIKSLPSEDLKSRFDLIFNRIKKRLVAKEELEVLLKIDRELIKRLSKKRLIQWNLYVIDVTS